MKTAKKTSTAIEAAKLEGVLTCAATWGLLQSYGRKVPGPFYLVDVGDGRD